MSTTGIVQSGWSDPVSVLGDFDRALRISGAIMDVDGDGKPDLVIYITERGSPAVPIVYSYFRVGNDINSEGIVEGGWTNQKTTPSMEK